MNRLLLLLFILVLSVTCMAQEYDSLYAKQVEEAWKKLEAFNRGTTLEQTLDFPESLEVRVCVDEAYGLVLIISGGFFEKWRKLKAKYYTDIRIELPDTIIDLSYDEFVRRIKKEE